MNTLDALRDRRPSQVSKSDCARNLHLIVDFSCSRIQRSPKNVGKAENIVHLIGIVGSTSCDNRVAASFMCLLRRDLRIRIC